MLAFRQMSVLVVLVAAVGCGGESTNAEGSSSPSVTVSEESPSVDPDETCSALLSDEVLTPLGWSDLVEPGESAGRCERTSDTSTITVGRRLDLSSGDDAEAARSAYDQACVDLRRDDSLSPDTRTTWLADDVSACFRPFPKGAESGLAEMVLLTDDSLVVEVQVAAGQPTGEDNVQQMLTKLVPEIQRVW